MSEELTQSWDTSAMVVTWTIKKFSTKLERIKLTHAISSQYDIPDEWCIYLYPDGYKQENEDCTGQVILYNDIPPCRDNLKLRFHVLDCKMSKVQSMSFAGNLYREGGSGTWAHCLAERSYVLDKKNGILSDDKLVIVCEVYNDNQYTVFVKKDLKPLWNRLQEFNELEKLVCNAELYPDVTFIIDDIKFPAHKCILASRSSVFDAMFKHEMQEAATNVVVITDVKSRVMKELLRFLYCGKTLCIEDIAGDLLAAANKYDVPGLKLLCERSLCRTLTNENAIDNLQFADTHQAAMLKAEVIQYIVRNSTEIVELPNFNWLANSLPPNLLVELLGAAFQRPKK